MGECGWVLPCDRVGICNRSEWVRSRGLECIRYRRGIVGECVDQWRVCECFGKGGWVVEGMMGGIGYCVVGRKMVAYAIGLEVDGEIAVCRNVVCGSGVVGLGGYMKGVGECMSYMDVVVGMDKWVCTRVVEDNWGCYGKVQGGVGC